MPAIGSKTASLCCRERGDTPAKILRSIATSGGGPLRQCVCRRRDLWECHMRVAGRLLSAVAVTGLVAGCLAAAAPGARAATSAPTGVRAPWAEVANAVSGADLWSRTSVTKRPMGSITKVMTAYVVIETGGLGRVVTVPAGITAYDKKFDASTAGLVPGEKLTALQLLYAMLLPSGCDAAYALAAAYGPGLGKFIARMNATAAKLGLSQTHFTDFS